MTGPAPQLNGAATPWQRYLEREHAARGIYLNVTAQAHFDYLSGPWPDRDAYQDIERNAWHTYYQAGREAWQRYRAEAEELSAPPLPDRVPGEAWRELVGGGHHLPGDSPRPLFTPNPERTD